MPLIRPARPDDLAELLAIEAAAFAGDRLSRRALRHHLGCGTISVAEVEGAVAGYALLLRRAAGRRARLYSIAVEAGRRRGGIGGALLADAEARAAALGCTELALEVRADNPAAIALYERSGYRPAGTIADFYEDGAPALRLVKGLAAG